MKCAVECGNPANYKYTWRDSNNALLLEGPTETYQYDVNAQSVDQKFEVTCTVSNNIVTANLAESQTKFIIAFVETTTGKQHSLFNHLFIFLIIFFLKKTYYCCCFGCWLCCNMSSPFSLSTQSCKILFQLSIRLI